MITISPAKTVIPVTVKFRKQSGSGRAGDGRSVSRAKGKIKMPAGGCNHALYLVAPQGFGEDVVRPPVESFGPKTLVGDV